MGYANPKMDELMDRQRSVQDPGERRRLFRQVSDLMNEDAVYVPYHHGSDLKGLLPNVKSFVHTQDSIKNAILPVVTVLGIELELGSVFSGAIITETIFAIPGIGRLLVDSATADRLRSDLAMSGADGVALAQELLDSLGVALWEALDIVFVAASIAAALSLGFAFFFRVPVRSEPASGDTIDTDGEQQP